MTDREVEHWLRDKGTTLWGQYFEVVSGSGRQAAAEWFVAQVEDFSEWKQRVLARP